MTADLDTFEAACRAADGKLAAADNQSYEPEIERLAKLPRLEYERRREDTARLLGVRVAALDKIVREQRTAAEDDAAALPHWKVEPSPKPVDGAALLDHLRQVFRHYIVLPKGADVALPLWVLHAWTFDAGEISPFMVLVSPVKRCGKTSVLILLYYLTPKSELASNISPTAIFRYIEETRPTLLIDEADSFVKDNEELRGILNSGHTGRGQCNPQRRGQRGAQAAEVFDLGAEGHRHHRRPGRHARGPRHPPHAPAQGAGGQGRAPAAVR
jgi:hypothetical protein